MAIAGDVAIVTCETMFEGYERLKVIW